MRDPERIDRICDKLKELWKFFPDQRFTQLFDNYVVKRANNHFYQEDHVSERNIDDQINFIKHLMLEKDKLNAEMEKESVIEFINGKSTEF